MAVTGYFVNDTSSVIGLTDTKATLDTDSSQGANAALIYTAVDPGVRGNSIKIAQTVPTDDNAAHALSVSVVRSGNFDIITVQLAVSSDGSTITSTGSLIMAAVNADPDASKLVSVALKAANDGSGLASTFSATALSGGALDDIKAGEIRKVTAMSDANAILLINGGASFVPSATYDKRRAVARLLKYGAVSEDRQS